MDDGSAPGLDASLEAAVEMYRTEIANLDNILAVDPAHAEALQIKGQLEDALQETLAALQQMQQDPAAEEAPAPAATDAVAEAVDAETVDAETVDVAAQPSSHAEAADVDECPLPQSPPAARPGSFGARTAAHARAAAAASKAQPASDTDSDLEDTAASSMQGGAVADAAGADDGEEVSAPARQQHPESMAHEQEHDQRHQHQPSRQQPASRKTARHYEDYEADARKGFTVGGTERGHGYNRASGRVSRGQGHDDDEAPGPSGRQRPAPVEQARGRQGRNNPRMHPSNKYYREEPDFAALANQYPALRKYMQMHPGGRAVFDYTSWEGTRQLTATLLKADFGIEWWLPEGQLVPTVTNRANYIHWINDLLQLSSPEGADSSCDAPVRGLDIGCGANFIYCLLGAAIYGWNMVGVDITDVAVRWSQKHISRNPHMGQLLEVRRSGAVGAAAAAAAAPGGAAPGAAAAQAADAATASAAAADADGDEQLPQQQPQDQGLDQQEQQGGGGAADAAACDAGADAAGAACTAATGGGSGIAAEGSAATAGAAAADGAAGGDAQVAPSSRCSTGTGLQTAQDEHEPCDEQLYDQFNDNASYKSFESYEDPGGIITPALADDHEVFAFTMCNPPFFESMREANSNPNTACGGTETEMVYAPGGEAAFIMRMVEDSVRLGGRVHWYTTMVGKKATLKVLRKELHSRHVTAIRTTELAQGKTSRWAIAWSFTVDPNLASVPLTRPVNPTLAVPVQAKRSTSFALRGSQTDARKLLEAIEQVMTAHGALCAVDPLLWRVNAVLGGAPAAGGRAAAAGGVAGAGDSNAAGAAAGASKPGGAAGAAGAAAASVAPQAPGQLQQQKKARGPAAVAAAAAREKAAALAAAAASGGLSVRVNVFQQQQRGQFEITASVPNNAGLPEATRFTMLMQKVQSDLQAMWH